jgi:hypothetical protein
MGSGKTSLQVNFLIEHLKKDYRGSDEYAYILTAGDGYDLVRDLDNVLVFYYELEDNELAPLDFHPLALFFHFGSKGIEAARSWLSGVLYVEDQFYKDGILTILNLMAEKSEIRLSDFYTRFEKWVHEKWPDGETEADHSSRKTLSKLYNYCDFKGSAYGKLFEPATPKVTSFQDIKTVLVTQQKGKSDASEALTSFFSLATEFYNVWDNVVDAPLFMLIDELEHLIDCKAIGKKEVGTLTTQGRKHGKFTVMGTQFMSLLFDLGMQSRFKRFLFADEISAKYVEAIMNLDTSDERRKEGLKAYEKVAYEMSYLRPASYAWGYVSNNRVHALIHDLSLEDLWLIASHKPARDLKSRMKKKFGLDFFQTARALSLTGLKPPKKDYDYPSEEILETLDVIILSNLNELKEYKP